MWLEIRNLHTKVVRADEDELAWISGYLSFEDASAQYRNRGKSDGRFRMFNVLSNTFPSGLVPLVRKGAAKEGVTIELADKRVRPCEPDPQADLAWLRDYQHDAMRSIFEKGRGVIWMATGGGKGELPASLGRALSCRWLFLVHRSTLVEQTAERFERRTGEPAGRIYEGRWLEERVTFATFQTIAAALKKEDERASALLQSVGGLVCDEAHTVAADSFYRIAMSTPNAYWRVGLSATPMARGDRRSALVVAALGPVIYRLKAERLIEEGVLARPKIHLLPVVQTSTKPTWQGVYGDCVVRSTVRNRALVQAAKKAPKPCLLFVKEITHGRLLLKALQKEGLHAEFIWGSDSTEARGGAIKRLVRSDLDVLVCSVVFQEGVDVPELRSVIIGSGGKSVIAALQRIGRGMRKAEGKDEFTVYDILDRGNGMLERHAKERLKAYMAEGHQTVVESSVGKIEVDLFSGAA